MAVEGTHILPTDKSPEVFLNPDGTIKIHGRGLVVNRTGASDVIIDWIDKYLDDPAEVTYVTIEFEYLNSFSTTTLVTMLKKLSRVLLKSRKIKIIWYYEEDDEDIMERGEYIAAALNMPIEFIVKHKSS
jgi:hypothetical protein